jgi:hypothetical protein
MSSFGQPSAFSPVFAAAFQSGRAEIRVILVPTSGGPSAEYVTTMNDDLAIESISLDVDATNSSEDPYVTADVLDSAGMTLSSVRSGQALTLGFPGEATFAPNLPDSIDFFTPFPVRTIQAALWEIQPSDGDIVRLTASDPDAVITQVRIAVDTLSGMTGAVEIPPPWGDYAA